MAGAVPVRAFQGHHIAEIMHSWVVRTILTSIPEDCTMGIRLEREQQSPESLSVADFETLGDVV